MNLSLSLFTPALLVAMAVALCGCDDTVIYGSSCDNPARRVSYIARWDGANWGAMPFTVDGFVAEVLPDSATGGYYLDGGFSNVVRGHHGVPVHWHPVSGMSPLGLQIEGTIYDVVGYKSGLIAGGPIRRFINNDSSEVRGDLARWDGDRWLPIPGMVDGTVWSLAVSNDTLVVVGNYSLAGNVAARNLALFDFTNSQWQRLEGAPINVISMAAVGNTIYFAGEFDVVNGTGGYHNVACYDRISRTWSTMGGGVCATSDFEVSDRVYSYVWTIVVLGNEIVIAGHFDAVGG